MSSATDAPLVETTVPTDGQTPPQPATRPQPTTLAPRRMTIDLDALEVFLVTGAGIGAGLVLRVAVPDHRDVIVFGGLGLLLTAGLVGLALLVLDVAGRQR